MAIAGRICIHVLQYSSQSFQFSSCWTHLSSLCSICHPSQVSILPSTGQQLANILVAPIRIPRYSLNQLYVLQSLTLYLLKIMRKEQN